MNVKLSLIFQQFLLIIHVFLLQENKNFGQEMNILKVIITQILSSSLSLKIPGLRKLRDRRTFGVGLSRNAPWVAKDCIKFEAHLTSLAGEIFQPRALNCRNQSGEVPKQPKPMKN